MADRSDDAQEAQRVNVIKSIFGLGADIKLHAGARSGDSSKCIHTYPNLICPSWPDYSCALQSKILLHGRMYLTSKNICFYSNLFGFEKKVG
jgi:hypothetical protein